MRLELGKLSIALTKTILLLITGAVCSAQAEELSPATALPAESADALIEREQSTRIDFDDARIKGQSIKAGAVYLTNRKNNDIESMLQQREDYREDILQGFEYDVYNNDAP